MDFSPIELTPAQQEFAQDVRSTLDRLVTPEVHEHERVTGDGFNESVHLGLGAKGWLFPAWPVADGGAGLDRVSCRILDLELQRARVPSITTSTTDLVWAAVAASARPELAAELMPGVAAGTVRMCLGYTDPEGGSDIAASHLRAVRDGDEWVLNGAKMFTTGAHNCQYTFLITRTDPSLPKHRGLTMFLVPLDLPGVEIQAIRTYGGERTNAVYYSEVRVPDRYRLGHEPNDGWAVMRGPLDAEHSAGDSTAGLGDVSGGASYLRQFELAIGATLDWARTATRPDGSPVAEDSAFLERLGRQIVEHEAGVVTPGPMGRIKGSIALIEGAAELVDLIGPEALLPHGAEGAIADGEIEFAHRWAQGTATYGGTTEVFRNIVAQHVLGLPRAEFPGSRALVR
jgi:alkylation response protein AidB-like acyl-CoA dehydrogenase